jgi:ATP-binding cassette subfamily B protein
MVKILKMTFPFSRQYDTKDCGPACLKMIYRYHYGQKISLEFLREKCETTRRGSSFEGLARGARTVGLNTEAVVMSLEGIQQSSTPLIVHWNNNHFVIVYNANKKKVWVADPAKGKLVYSVQEFLSHWSFENGQSGPAGLALLIEPDSNFKDSNNIPREDRPGNELQLRHYLFTQRRLFLRLVLGMVVASALQLTLPILTQMVVDIGVGKKDIHFITLLLVGEMMIFLGSSVVDFTRSWILLHMSKRIYVSLLTNFFIKLMRLPLSYFDTKMTGDIIQRMEDQGRIQAFLTNSLLNFTFAIFNILIYSIIITTYSSIIFLVFLVGSLLYLSWVLFFLKKRKELDYKRFEFSSRGQSAALQMIQGIQEIKLNNGESQKRWAWERIQIQLFQLNMRTMSVGQFQQAGALFINQGKNVIITYLTVIAVIHGKLTLGSMLAVQFILGQLNSPIQQLISFIQSLQDAKISMKRINEIHSLTDEEPRGKKLLTSLPRRRTIFIKGLHYRYPGDDNGHVLKDINLVIPEGKTTAIVGMSGSGKTTLLKILLKIYQISEGEICIDDTNLNDISHSFWRSKCGIVMQDGFIFSDTIARNICISEEQPDINRIANAIKISNLDEFVRDLPMGTNTTIGGDGPGISQGQKQRLLIARTAYKEPDYIFFDEATNALDSTNEKEIMQKLDGFFKGRTVVIVAHRLSTVRKADQIVVLDKGKIVERGTHNQLIMQKGNYYMLVKNQLEIDD